MLQMTEEQRVETLIMNVQASGMAFKDMDRFTQKAIAAAAGISDMNKANRIFGMDLAGYQNYQKEMSQSQKDQETLNEALRKAQPIMQKIKIAFMQLLPRIEPYIELIPDLIDNVSDFIKEFKQFIHQALIAVSYTHLPLPTIYSV